MLPPPTISFTIPSIEDDLPLACRIYLPTCLTPTTIPHLPIDTWRKRAAIIAHPYAPLGGCYDDPVVDIVANAVLKEGFIVGTFNFRGAGASKGHTSWQSKSEQNDYISFLAFMIYFLYDFKIPAMSRPTSASSGHNLSPVPSHQLPPPHLMHENTNQTDPTTRIIIGGYSYGALIATFLPSSLEAILEPFQKPAECTAHAEIRLRASHLASEQTSTIAAQFESVLAQARPPQRGRSLQFSEDGIHNPKARQISSVRVGGEEDIRRPSHDSPRPRPSFNLHETPERVRKSIDRVRSLARDRGRQASSSSQLSSPTKGLKRQDSDAVSMSFESVHTITKDEQRNGTADRIQPISDISSTLKPAYLLISPPINHLSGLASFWSSASKIRQAEIHEKLTGSPTLALFGDSDGFVSVKRFRAWAEGLRSEANTRFVAKEMKGASHFWNRKDDAKALREEVRMWVKDL